MPRNNGLPPLGPALDLSPAKVGWRVAEWAKAVGISRSRVWELIAAEAVVSVKLYSSRIILTAPRTFLDALRTPSPAAVVTSPPTPGSSIIEARKTGGTRLRRGRSSPPGDARDAR